ncbi:FAD-dependent oxidoreductase [Salinispirillum sp. LH 10-3-1]|uniref:FAD-dependent oxidoreductase n=1 Tax=Salinispirillum sp. LH 10-3-1 TaxID=2952525 RepID=A0AB38YE68_9GAMM
MSRTGIKHVDVAIIGAGASGCANAYMLSRYTNARSVAIFDRHKAVAQANSGSLHNSQTLHCGDIETNYSREKAEEVKATANMVANYVRQQPDAAEIGFRMPKMVLAVGEAEIAHLRERWSWLQQSFPYLSWLEAADIAAMEPSVMAGRTEPVAAIGVADRVAAIDFAALSRSLLAQAQQAQQDKQDAEPLDVQLGNPVETLVATVNGYTLQTAQGVWQARAVLVCAGGHSLLYAQRMGYGHEYTCLPMAGNYYTAPACLKGKVYTVQNDKLPFAAVHGDVDVLNPAQTRFGPTTWPIRRLERYLSTSKRDFKAVEGAASVAPKALLKWFRDADLRPFMLRNMVYQVPGLRRYSFLRQARKVVPELQRKNLTRANGVGGLRPQLIDRTTLSIVPGEVKMDTGAGLIFNMTPSPGATSCLGNAWKDTQSIGRVLGLNVDAQRVQQELLTGDGAA